MSLPGHPNQSKTKKKKTERQRSGCGRAATKKRGPRMTRIRADIHGTIGFSVPNKSATDSIKVETRRSQKTQRNALRSAVIPLRPRRSLRLKRSSDCLQGQRHRWQLGRYIFLSSIFLSYFVVGCVDSPCCELCASSRPLWLTISWPRRTRERDEVPGFSGQMKPLRLCVMPFFGWVRPRAVTRRFPAFRNRVSV